MMTTRKRRMVFGVIVGIAVLSAAMWQLWRRHSQPPDPYGMAFKFLGCRGDWPVNLPIKEIVTSEGIAAPAFHIHDPVDCGLVVRDPAYKVNGQTLSLSYALREDGPVAACYCDYESRFTFSHLPANIKHIAFAHHYQ